VAGIGSLLRRTHLIYAIVTLIGAFLIVRLIGAPTFTDAYYHFNGGVRLASGVGFTEPYLWNYIGAPDALPPSGVFPSHTYWMPLTSILASIFMALFGTPGRYADAQTPFVFLLWGAAWIGYFAGYRLCQTPRHAWIAGLIALCGGYYARFWGTIDTFAPYAFFGAACLVLLGARHTTRRIAAAGVCAGLAHLTRADGLLLLAVGGWAILFFQRGAVSGKNTRFSLFFPPPPRALRLIAVFTLSYLVVMTPWFARNLAELGSPLPLGGTSTIWLREYNDLFIYPPAVLTPAYAFADGGGAFIAARGEAAINNLGTFVAVEGAIVMTPFILIALWKRRRDPFGQPLILYALGLHIVMTFVFPFPGYRGGLFHSAAALFPLWAAYGVVGVDDAVDWIAKRRRRWRAVTAKRIFSAGLLGVVLYLSALFGFAGRVPTATGAPTLYTNLIAALPDDARLLINDPAALYHYTGMGGVALPNASPDVIIDIARRYQIGYLLLEAPEATPAPLWSLFDAPPAFLTPIPFEGGLLYAIRIPPA
jgi:hypothetical protein